MGWSREGLPSRPGLLQEVSSSRFVHDPAMSSRWQGRTFPQGGPGGPQATQAIPGTVPMAPLPARGGWSRAGGGGDWPRPGSPPKPNAASRERTLWRPHAGPTCAHRARSRIDLWKPEPASRISTGRDAAWPCRPSSRGGASDDTLTETLIVLPGLPHAQGPAARSTDTSNVGRPAGAAGKRPAAPGIMPAPPRPRAPAWRPAWPPCPAAPSPAPPRRTPA